MTVPFELIQVQAEGIAPDQLVWRRYRRPTPGVVEYFLDINPEIARGFRDSPFLPVGAVVKMPIFKEYLGKGQPSLMQQVRLYGRG